VATRIDRIINNIKLHAGTDIYREVKKTRGTRDVKAIVSELGKVSGTAAVAGVMRACGRQCIPNSYIIRARSIYEDSDNLEDFLTGLNKLRIGGGKLHTREGKIIGIYEQCYCTLARKTKDLSPLYCYCSEGWYEELFSAVFEKQVEVKKLHTILDGSSCCEFEINCNPDAPL
jgi:predicted hydrocarbon binding protein